MAGTWFPATPIRSWTEAGDASRGENRHTRQSYLHVKEVSEMHTIVVGVDGSEASLQALQYAVEGAPSHGADVKAVKAWEVPPSAYGTAWSVPVHPEDFAKVAQEQLDKSLADTDLAASGVRVTPILREGRPGDVLCAEANEADMLVVGSRGLGGF